MLCLSGFELYSRWVPLNTERELERGFELGFKPGLRTRASLILLITRGYKF